MRGITYGKAGFLVAPGPRRGITIGQITDLYNHFRRFTADRNMYYVVAHIVKPLTKDKGSSFAELVGALDVQFFVSHFWGHVFESSVESLQKHAKAISKDRIHWRAWRYWMCSLSISQWHVGDEVGSHWRQSSFYLALTSASCIGTVMIVDENMLPLARSWCLFEILQTFLIVREHGCFAGLMFATDAGVISTGEAPISLVMAIANTAQEIRVEHASATQEADKQMIDDAVLEYGGHDWVNTLIRNNVKDALLLAKTRFEDKVEEAVAKLDAATPRIAACSSWYEPYEPYC